MFRQKKYIIIFLAPAFLLFGYVFLFSIIQLVATSFTDWTIGGTPTFCGLKNYIYLFSSDDGFKKGFVNTLAWIILQSTVHICIGICLALLLRRTRWYSKLVRTTIMIPNIISSAALGMLFLCMLNPQFGLVNSVISKITGEPFTQNWFLDSKTAFFSVSMTWIPYSGLITILMLAEMSSISSEIYESARVEGASEIQIDLKICLPMMKSIIGTSTILAATSMLQKLDILVMTTNGGPANKTVNMPLYLYKTALTDNNYGLANAQGVILVAFGLIVVSIIRKVYRMKDN